MKKKAKNAQKATFYYDKALEIYRKTAENGNIIAQYNLGMAYNFGRGVQQDIQKASNWVTKSAENGYVIAQNTLGNWYLDGHKPIKQDTDKAIYWYMQAAEKNNAIAESNLAYVYSKTSKREIKKYVYWLKRAAEHGHTVSQCYLGKHYELGNCEGISKDYNQAAYWYQQGALLDNDCAFSLAIMYRDGKGVEKNPQLEKYWKMRSDAIGDSLVHPSVSANAEFELANMYETGNNIVPQSIYLALRWYRMAASKGHTEAQYRIGKAYVDDKDFQHGIFWLKEAVKQDHPLAMRYLGIIYRDGLGVEKNDEYAKQWFQEAENATARSNLRERLKAFGADAYIIGNNVNVRKFPKTSSEIVAQLNIGHAVKRGVSNSFAIGQGGNVLTENGKWNFIQTEEGIKGWVLNKYLRTMILNIPNDKGFKEVANRELKNNIQPTTILSKAQYNSFVKIFEEGSLDKLKAKIEQEHISINAIYRSEDYSNIDANLLSIATSQTSNLEIIKFLLAEGADVNRKTTGWRDLGPEAVPVSNMTALMKASICYDEGKPTIVKALLDAGADINSKDSENMTALAWALETSVPSGISNSAKEVIKTLIDAGAATKDSLLYAFSEEGLTPDILEMLLEAGADVNADEDILIKASMTTKYPEIIDILLNAGINAKIKSKTEGWFNGKRAIDFAKENFNLKDTEALKRLYEESYESPEEREKEEAEKKAVQQAEFQKLLQKAEQGDVIAQSNVGFKYLLGMDGVEIDGVKAIYWFKKAAEQEDMGSIVKLSSLYKNGDESAGIKKDEKEAKFWGQKADEIRYGKSKNTFQANASITGDKVNIRTKPTTSSSVVKQLNAGHPVKATKKTKAKDGTWFYIQTASGTQGWVFGKYVKIK